jgi:hypothetical protein
VERAASLPTRTPALSHHPSLAYLVAERCVFPIRPKNAAVGLGALLLGCFLTIVVLATGGDDGGVSTTSDAAVPDDVGASHRSVQGCTADDDPLASPQTSGSAPAPDIAQCQISIVGAGPGGVYTAWRLAKDSVEGDDAMSVPPERICVFERSQRLGGRIFSVRNLGPEGDLVVESGAYRFSSDGATPLLTALIQTGLNLPWVACEKTCASAAASTLSPPPLLLLVLLYTAENLALCWCWLL